MNIFGERLRTERKKKKLTQKQLADKFKMSESAIGMYERGEREPSLELISGFANFFGVSSGYLLGDADQVKEGKTLTLDKKERLLKADSDYSFISEGNGIIYRASTYETKDEKDIAKRMKQIRNDLAKGDGLSFDGEPMSEEAIESLLEAMEYAVRQTQRINKKYIPKKYRKEDNN